MSKHLQTRQPQGGYLQHLQTRIANPQEAVDVGACAPGGAYPYGPNHPFAAAAQTPGQYAQPGQIYAIDFALGFCGYVTHEGNFLAANIVTGETGPTLQFEDLGPDLTFQVGNGGFFQIWGVNFVAADNVCATVFRNRSNLENLGGDVPLEIYSTDGCWCPFDDCISAAQDSNFVLNARVVPGLDDERRDIIIDDENEPVFVADLRMAFRGTLFRTVEGCVTTGMFAPLGAGLQFPPAVGGAPGLTPPGM